MVVVIFLISISFLITALNTSLIYIEDTYINGIILIFVAGNIITVISCYFLFNHLSFHYQQEKIVEITKLREETILEYRDKIEKSHKEIRKMNHDIIGHLDVLTLLIDSNDKNRAVMYIKELRGNLDRINRVAKTGNFEINAILDKKKAEAECFGVDFKVENNNLDNIPLSQVKISILLNNLLSNAIEANEKKQMEVRNSLRLVSSIKKDYFF